MTYGFIIIRHVNSEITNKYWNESVRCIRRIYPHRKIVVIDDNSIQSFVKNEMEYQNVEYIQSEFPQRGELLPYYYFHKHHFFDNAIIIHDSVFIQKRINFDAFENAGIRVLPLWHFSEDKIENEAHTVNLCRVLKNNREMINDYLYKNDKYTTLGMSKQIWTGCFGAQSFINYNFLNYLQAKYQLFNLLSVIKTRPDRCCLERILGAIFNLECPRLKKISSMFGSIHTYMRWGYTYKEYRDHMDRHKRAIVPVVKVWTGR